MGALGWSFYPPIRGEDGEYLKTSGEVGEDDGLKDVIRDPLYDSKFVRELYFKVRCTLSSTIPAYIEDKLTIKPVPGQSGLRRTFHGSDRLGQKDRNDRQQ